MKEFIALHTPALGADEARHNLILGLLGAAAGNPDSALRRWTLGGPGACAIQTPGWPLILGELDETQCHVFAQEAHAFDFPGVVGPDRTAAWFADRARKLGVVFAEPIPQSIQAIHDRPRYPGAPGAPRPVTADDAALMADWLMAFAREATPHEPTPRRERFEKAAAEGQYLFWTVDDAPVSLGGIQRRTPHGAAIAGIYTPPPSRGRGYAGSVTAALVERVYAEGRSFVCLYTDLGNPTSNRCYAKVGFAPVCASMLFPRLIAPDWSTR